MMSENTCRIEFLLANNIKEAEARMCPKDGCGAMITMMSGAIAPLIMIGACAETE